MMNTAFQNLDQLSQELYQKLITEAEAEIDQLQKTAEQERKELLKATEQEIQAMRKAAEREIRLEHQKSLENLKREALLMQEDIKGNLENFLKQDLILEGLSESFSKEDFVAKLIMELVKKFDPESHHIIWPKSWPSVWLEGLRTSLEAWRIEIGDGSSLSLKTTDKGMEFQFGEDQFKQLLETYFNEDLLPLLFQND